LPLNYTYFPQVGDADFDHTFWASPEALSMERPAWQVNETCPGSEVAGDFASAFASAYMVFSEICGGKVILLFTCTFKVLTISPILLN